MHIDEKAVTSQVACVRGSEQGEVTAIELQGPVARIFRRRSLSSHKMSLQDKRACLWHAFCTLDEQNTGSVLKSKLKVSTEIGF
jgi:hypothetical protein